MVYDSASRTVHRNHPPELQIPELMAAAVLDVHTADQLVTCEPLIVSLVSQGRWWWEDAAAKECGLHSGNIQKGDGKADGAKAAERDLWAAGSVAAVSKEQAAHSPGQAG